jgi:tetratricopeptide (TPR) repeat protein
MTQHRPEQNPAGRAGDTHSHLSGTAGNAIQARDVSGGVHFHQLQPNHGHLVPRQLPRDVPGFVGRTGDVARLDSVLGTPDGDTALPEIVSIAGTAGVGKTSLAIHWAHRIQQQFPDGQLYVNLRGYGPESPVGASDVLERFLGALGIPEQSIPANVDDRSALYRSLLADRHVLILLDNAATVGQVRPLLPGMAGCFVIVTSRSRLSGLISREGAHPLNLDMLSPDEAKDLVRITTAEFRPADSPDDLAELAQLCARLPLALRIAAERAASRPHLALGDLIDELRNESSLWDALSSEDGDEADSVRAVFAWSYRVLPPAAARLFRLLGLHPGADFTADAASALTGQELAPVRGLLDLLVGAHLLERTAAGRYQFHDLLRAYAADEAHQEEPLEEQRHALKRILSWYLHTAAAATTAIQDLYQTVTLPPCPEGVTPISFTDHASALRWYREEQNNLLAAVRAAAADGLDDRTAWQLTAVLHGIHAGRPAFDGWFTMGTIALEATRRLGDRTAEALIQATLGNAHKNAHHTLEALEHYQQALAISEELQDPEGQQQSINTLGLLHLKQRQLTEARERFEQLLQLSAQLPNPKWNAVANSNLAATYIHLGEPELTRDLATAALQAHKDLNSDQGVQLDPLLDLSRSHRMLGQPQESTPLVQQALDIAHERDNPVTIGFALLELGLVQRANDEHDAALATYQHAAAIHREIHYRRREAEALDATGETLQELGRSHEAIDFHRMAVSIQREQQHTWLLAVALNNLATALDQTGQPTQAREHWYEAASLLTDFYDPPATTLRDCIAEKLARPPEPPQQQADTAG